ncbi:MAG TPA: sphingomyelin phosphodiesterase [Polyangiaceae bacterium LLY-WYZ-15_(1-7)]|nr:hypothetical protein [Myxococcales bacterium]MAT25096.1 hypothetical protein [Sandaracinus sp.]HJK89896.1 sphingomyelin phosphodiesterase [Polyangiaceae bacterium LLY-WYZ-15_(1-7)]MBJ72685.1 hypothetical protein [Sandaracinus sp.]HJL05626.1 sphingomyelin phosphodiesterase [Polyangiaceae bacterium LLY-WYZ-15_(1-7)]
MTVSPIQVLTYNVKLLPAYAKLVVTPKRVPEGWWERGAGRQKDAQRAEAILKALVKGSWDVIVLQELYPEPIRDRFREVFEQKGWETTPALGDDLLNEDSGLFVASRLPFVTCRFQEFDAKIGFDALSDKGVVALRLDTSKVWKDACEGLYLFGTHLQSDDEHYPVRLLQLDQLARLAHQTLEPLPEARRKKVAAMALGDFNVRAETAVIGMPGASVPTPEYAAMLSLLGRPRDLYRHVNPQDAGFTWDGTVGTMTRPSDDDRKRIDYAFAFDWVPQPKKESEPSRLLPLHCSDAHVAPFFVDGRHLSDHFGVSVRVAP